MIIIGSRQWIESHSSDQVNTECDGNQIMKVDEAKSLGLVIDKHLTWSRHIEEKSKKISSAIGALKRIRLFYFHKHNSASVSSPNWATVWLLYFCLGMG